MGESFLCEATIECGFKTFEFLLENIYWGTLITLKSVFTERTTSNSQDRPIIKAFY